MFKVLVKLQVNFAPQSRFIPSNLVTFVFRW